MKPEPETPMPGVAWDGVAVIGAGPAGLFAAQCLAEDGIAVRVLDHMPSAGRKLLVAGRSGLNLTHSTPAEEMPRFYSGGGDWAGLIAAFPPDALRNWAHALGSDTFVGTSGRIFPEEMMAGGLLRRWMISLKKLGVEFQFRKQWRGFATPQSPAPSLLFGDDEIIHARAVIFALGGASWKKTGSDGGWAAHFQNAGIKVNSFQPANCGYNVQWPEALLCHIEGQPLKNLAVCASATSVRGELMLTRNGIEGGAIYALSSQLRHMQPPMLMIDFKPDTTSEALQRRLQSIPPTASLEEKCKALKLTSAATALIQHFGNPSTDATLATSAKALALELTGPRPIDEAISSAGGVAWSELSNDLQLLKAPYCYVCGEMIDWEAPTGGFLLQGCFATAFRAANACAEKLF